MCRLTPGGSGRTDTVKTEKGVIVMSIMPICLKIISIICVFLVNGFSLSAGFSLPVSFTLTAPFSAHPGVERTRGVTDMNEYPAASTTISSSVHSPAPRFIAARVEDFSAPGVYSTAFVTADIPGQGETMNDSRIYYPVEGDTIPSSASPCPIVVFGHGWMMGIDRYYSFAEHFASWGYVTVLPTYSNPVFFPEHERRARCLVAAGRYVAALDDEYGHLFYGKLDPERWGFAGHSLGGSLSMLAGALFSESSLMDTLRVLVSLSGPDTSPSTEEENLILPKMILGGTKDLIVPWEDIKRDIWDNSPAPGTFAVFSGANHNQFMDWSTALEDLFDGTPEISRERQLMLTRRHMTAYMERYVKGDRSQWNYQFCYGDSVRFGEYIDYAEIREEDR
jgi:dienelactone hydrolase